MRLQLFLGLFAALLFFSGRAHSAQSTQSTGEKRNNIPELDATADPRRRNSPPPQRSSQRPDADREQFAGADQAFREGRDAADELRPGDRGSDGNGSERRDPDERGPERRRTDGTSSVPSANTKFSNGLEEEQEADESDENDGNEGAGDSRRRGLRRNLNLAINEIASIVAFLESLTDPCVNDRSCIDPWIVDSDDLADYPDDSALIGHDRQKLDL